MADESGRLSSDYGDDMKDNNLYENGVVVDDVDFSDPDEFVDDVTDDGLCTQCPCGSISRAVTGLTNYRVDRVGQANCLI